jgi:hypothetical protein
MWHQSRGHQSPDLVGQQQRCDTHVADESLEQDSQPGKTEEGKLHTWWW